MIEKIGECKILSDCYKLISFEVEDVHGKKGV
jgi:hypothetical protein